MKKTTHAKTILPLAAATATWIFCTVGSTEAGLVGHWEFDNAADVGQATVSSSLEAVGDAAYSASGKIGGALALDGTGDYLRVDGSDSLASGLPTGATSFTVAAFIQTTANGDGIIGWGNYGSGGQVNAFRTNGANGLLHYSWGGGVDYAVTATGVTDGTWHHVAATYDGTTKRIYLDGVELDSGKAVGALNIGAANFRIGSTNAGEFFNGLIDDVRVYDEALSESAISALATGGGSDTTPPEISSLSPGDGATEAPTSDDLVATFDEAVQAGTNGNITLKRASDDLTIETFDVTTSIQLTFGGSNVTINPTSDLVAGVEYYVLIDVDAIEDTADNGFAGIIAPPAPSKWTFTADGTAPTSTSMGPMADATDFSPGADLTINFGEDVQLGTGNITIHLADTTTIETIDVTGGAVTISGADVTIDISDLALSTAYYVNIASGAFEDLSGNEYAGITGTTTWAFTTVGAPTLVGHWEFDNAADVGEASVSSNLEAVGDAAYSASGKIGGALALDGTGDYLRVDGLHTLASGMPTGDASYTISLFMQTTQTGQQHMVTWGNGATTEINAFRTTTAGEFGATVGILNYNWGGGANGDYGQGAGGDIADGAWYHVAVTYDSGTSTKHLYVDGVELGSGLVVSNDLNVQGINFRIGTDRNGGNSFNGLIDDVRVYDGALSESEISALATPAGGDTFSDWQTANSTAGGLDDDHDGDGVQNGVEFFLGGPNDTTGFTALPGVDNTGGTLSVTWTRDGGYPGTYGTDYWVEISTTLLPGSWSLADPGDISGDVTYTFPAPLGTPEFARLVVTGP